MALFPRTITPSLETVLPCGAHRIGEGYTAGEALIPGPCYIKPDGTVWQSTGAAANAAAKVDGWLVKAQPNVGGAVTLWEGVDIGWGPATGFAPGTTVLYLSATKGELDTAPTTGGVNPIAKLIYIKVSESPNHGVIRCRTSW